jgi:hypothetical protein
VGFGVDRVFERAEPAIVIAANVGIEIHQVRSGGEMAYRVVAVADDDCSVRREAGTDRGQVGAHDGAEITRFDDVDEVGAGHEEPNPFKAQKN